MRFTRLALLAALTLGFVGCASTEAVNYNESISYQGAGIQVKITMEISSPIVLGDQWLAQFEIRNEGDAAVSLLPWGTPWEGFLTQDIFRIERAGRRLEYIGPVVKRRAPTSADYLQIQAGSSRVVELDIRSGYDIDRRGEYTLSFMPGSMALRTGGQDRVVAMPEMRTVRIQLVNN